MTSSLLKYRYFYILSQAVVLGFLAMIVFLWDLKGSIPVFYFLIVWNIITYVYVLYNELTKSPSFHPFIIFALITLQYCGLSPIQTVGMMQTEEIVYLGATPINRVLTLGYLFLSIEHYMIYLGYFLYDNYKLRREDAHVSLIDSFSQYNINSLKVGVYNYLIVILLRSLDFFMPLATISSLLVTYANTGFLVSLSIWSYSLIIDDNTKIKRLYWLVTFAEILRVLNGGMKQAIITPLLPYMIYLIISYKQGLVKIWSLKFVLSCSLIVVFVIGFVFPYISTFRQISNEQHKEWKEVSVSETLDTYLNNLFSKEVDNGQKSGLEYFMSRAGSIGSNSFSIDYTDRNGISPDYFLYTTSAIIPRIIWPDKPKMLIGSIANFMSLGYAYEEAVIKAQHATKSTSITLGFIGSTYLAFGFIGAVVICLLAGYLTARIWYFVKYRQYNIFAIWLFYTLMTTIFVDYENFVDCGIIFYMWSVVYIIIIKVIDKYLFKWKEREYFI